MLSNKYNYKDDEPVLKKPKKVREKKIKESKEVDEPEVYRIIRETRKARDMKKGAMEADVVDDDDEEDEQVVNATPLIAQKLNNFVGEGRSEKSKNIALNAFHPVSLKYDMKFIDTLKTENEELKKHLADLRQIHSYNDRLNHINHSVHRMKIKLNNF